ncbi:MAG: methyltransferase domain-containing protein [Elainella sp. C42_A2020_010]|jgi:tetratricopeptide (TPR) repeat protein|nr:methyltransferase domain-containing protein [Elainella sp. C42_A2020_010]
MKFCKVADIQDWQDSEFQAISSLLMCGTPSRKGWEFIQVYKGLKHLGLLKGESKAIGLGVGHEMLIYAFTNVCQHVIATDLYESENWSTASMAVQEVYDKNPFPYQRERLTVQHMDMTQIQYPDESFDFVWSCCAIEHVNNFRELHKVYQEIHRVLKPGGIAALTTEFNPTDRPSYEPNMLFTDRQWMETWLTGADPLVQGFEVIDQPDFEVSNRPENQPLPRREQLPSIQVYCNDVYLNSIAFFLRKSGEFSRAYDESWLPEFWHLYLAGWDCYRAKDFTQAESLFRKLLQLDLEPRLKVRALRRLADTLYAQTKLEELRTVCLEVLPLCEIYQDEDHLMPLAAYCSSVGLDQAAIALYQKVEKLPSSILDLVILSQLNQAKHYEQQGKFEQALELVQKAEQSMVSGMPLEAEYRPKIYFRTGHIYEKMGKPAQAVRFYKQAIKQAIPDTQFQLNCYRHLTACLQTQLKRNKEKAEHLEATNRWMQTSKFWKLRSVVMSVKAKLQGHDPSPSL